MMCVYWSSSLLPVFAHSLRSFAYPTTQFEDVCGVEKMMVDRDEFVSDGSVGGGVAMSI